MSISNIKRQNTNKYLSMERETPIILNQNQILLHSTEWKERAIYIKSHCGDACVIFCYWCKAKIIEDTQTGEAKKIFRKLKETLTKLKVSTCQFYLCFSWNCLHCIMSKSWIHAELIKSINQKYMPVKKYLFLY